MRSLDKINEICMHTCIWNIKAYVLDVCYFLKLNVKIKIRFH